MKWFYNFKIGTKILVGFFIVAILSGTVGYIGITNMGKINNSSQNLYNKNLIPIIDLNSVEKNLYAIRADLLLLQYDRDPVKKEQLISDVNKLIGESAVLLDKYSKVDKADDELAIYKQFSDSAAVYQQTRSEYLKMIQENRYEEVAVYIDTVTKARQAAESDIAQLVKVLVSNAQKSNNENNILFKNVSMIMILVIIMSAVFSMVIGIVIARMISKPVKELADAADKLAVGDIDISVNTTRKDEIGKLIESFAKMVTNIHEQAIAVEKMADGDFTINVNVKSEKDLMGKKLIEMIEKLNELIGSVSAASDQVASGSSQISDSSIALSEGATEQASAIEELTSSMEEVTSQIQMNAKNANQANELAAAAKENAVLGNKQMQDMLKAMVEINDSSSNISKIIKVIDDIAFQTNILALNAAVEAARAGQHGKGFAVVAEEVRNLAARSANAAKETTDMIEGSIKKSEAGTKIANDTAKALNNIVDDITKVTNLVNDISVSSNEQASAAAQINQGIMQVSQVVQTNSATAEESAAASEELSSQAALLKGMTANVKLKKASSNIRKLDGLDPKVLEMLEDMMERNKAASENNEERKPEADNKTSRVKIVLNDSEFGKY